MTEISAKPREKEHGSTWGRLCGFVCVLAQIAVLLSWTNDYLTCVALAVLAWSAALGIRLPMRTLLQATPAYVVLAVLVVGKTVVAPFEVEPSRGYINSPMAFDLALYCMLTQIGVLFGYVGKRLPVWFPVFPVITMLLLSDVTIHTRDERYALLAADVLVAVTAGLIFRLSRRPAPATVRTNGSVSNGWVPHVIATVLVAAIGCGSALLLVNFERSIDRFLADWLGVGRGGVARTGFTGGGDLASVAEWQSTGSDKIALRVFSDAAPGYMAGRTFSSFNGSSWTRDWQLRPMPQTDLVVFRSELSRETNSDAIALDVDKQGRTLFALAPNQQLEQASDEGRTSPAASTDRVIEYEVWPEKHVLAVLYRPFGANFAAVESTTLPLDPAGNADLDKEQKGFPFGMYQVSALREAKPSDAELRHVLRLDQSRRPDQLEPALANTISQIFGADGYEHLTTAQKCTAVERFFQKNYKYRLGGVRTGRSSDRVAVFLTRYDFGHCEYFASATTLLLRSIGVPARYVTGFVVQEQNSIGDYWVARNQDAHAWVEAWDAENGGWRIVESTPSDGVPEVENRSSGGHFRDAVVSMFKQWRSSLRQRNLQQEITDRAADLLSPNVLLGVGCFAGVVAVFLSYQQRRGRVSDDLVPFHAALDRVMIALGSRGLVRRPEETLREFAARIADDGDDHWAIDTARWLNEYSQLRYRREMPTAGDGDAGHLEAKLETLTERARATARKIRSRQPSVETGVAKSER